MQTEVQTVPGNGSKPVSAPRSAAAPQSSLFEQIRRARLWLPVAIIGVVLLLQLLLLPRLPSPLNVWVPVLFYSVLGPLATFWVLDWIAGEVLRRERAQAETARLFDELSSSHETLGAIHDVTARYAAAPDLEAVMQVAAEGVRDVTGAAAVGVVVGSSDLTALHGAGMTPAIEADARARAEEFLPAGSGQPDLRRGSRSEIGGTQYMVLSHALTVGGRSEGSMHAYYLHEPDQHVREAFGILASQYTGAAEATRARLRDLLTLMEVDRTVRAEDNLERMLVKVLNEMMKRVSAPAGGIFLADEEGILNLSASVGMPRGATPVAYRVGEGLIGRVGESMEPLVLGGLTAIELGEDERANLGPLVRDSQSVLALPLIADSRLIGVTVLTHPKADQFEQASLPYLGLLASQVSLAVRNATAFLRSEELAITEERTRIAREIHDGVAQLLAFSALKLDLVDRLMDVDAERARAELDDARATVRETIREARRSIFALRPVDLERYGFEETVRRYVADFGQQNEVRVRLRVDDVGELSPKSEGVLFRIFQEAMHNVAKHSKARLVEVKLGTDESGMVYVEVRDDGEGFDVEEVSDRVTSAGGLGLKQMRERVESRGGCLGITSKPGEGTTLRAALPI